MLYGREHLLKEIDSYKVRPNPNPNPNPDPKEIDSYKVRPCANELPEMRNFHVSKWETGTQNYEGDDFVTVQKVMFRVGEPRAIDIHTLHTHVGTLTSFLPSGIAGAEAAMVYLGGISAKVEEDLNREIQLTPADFKKQW